MKNTVLLIVICAIVVSAAAALIYFAWICRKKVRLDASIESAVRFFRGAVNIKDKSPACRLWTEISAENGEIICRFIDPEGGEIAATARKIHIYGDESSENNKLISEAVNLPEFPDGTKISFDDEYTGYALIFAAKPEHPRLIRTYKNELIRALSAAGIRISPSADPDKITACISGENGSC